MRTRKERDQLVLQWLDLVPFAFYEVFPPLFKYTRRLGYADAMQIGRIGLLRAAERYDPAKGKFSNYAVHLIRGHVRHAARIDQFRCSKVSRCVQVTMPVVYEPECQDDLERQELIDVLMSVINTLPDRHKISVADRYGLNESGHEHTLEEIAGQLGVCRERARQLIASGLRKLGSEHRRERLAKLLGWPICLFCLNAYSDSQRECTVCGRYGCEKCVGKSCLFSDTLACVRCVAEQKRLVKR